MVFEGRVTNNDYKKIDAEVQQEASSWGKSIRNQVICAVVAAIFITIIAVGLAGGGGYMMYMAGLNTLPVFITGAVFGGAGVVFFGADATVIGVAIYSVAKSCKARKAYLAEDPSLVALYNKMDGLDENSELRRELISKLPMESERKVGEVEDDDHSSVDAEDNYATFNDYVLHLEARVAHMEGDHQKSIEDLSGAIEQLHAMREEFHSKKLSQDFIRPLFAAVLAQDVDGENVAKKKEVLDALTQAIVPPLLVDADYSLDGMGDLVAQLAAQLDGLDAIKDKFLEENANPAFLQDLFAAVVLQEDSEAQKSVMDALIQAIIPTLLIADEYDATTQGPLVAQLAAQLDGLDAIKASLYETDGANQGFLKGLLAAVIADAGENVEMKRGIVIALHLALYKLDNDENHIDQMILNLNALPQEKRNDQLAIICKAIPDLGYNLMKKYAVSEDDIKVRGVNIIVLLGLMYNDKKFSAFFKVDNEVCGEMFKKIGKNLVLNPTAVTDKLTWLDRDGKREFIVTVTNSNPFIGQYYTLGRHKSKAYFTQIYGLNETRW